MSESTYRCPHCDKQIAVMPWRVGEPATAVILCPHCKKRSTAAAPYPVARVDDQIHQGTWEAVATAVLMPDSAPTGTGMLGTADDYYCPHCGAAVDVVWDPRDGNSKIVRCGECQAFFSVLDKRRDPRARKPSSGRDQRPI